MIHGFQNLYKYLKNDILQDIMLCNALWAEKLQMFNGNTLHFLYKIIELLV